MWTDNGSKAFEVASALRAGVVWQNTYNRFDPTAAFGGYKESGFGREGGPSGLLPYVEADVSRRALVAKTYKLYLGGAFVRSESGRSDPTTDAPASTSPTCRARRARTSATRSRPRAPRRPAGRQRTAYNRGQVLYRFAEALESRSDELRAARRQQGRAPGARRARRRRRHARPLRGLDRQARRRDGRDQPGRRRRTCRFSTPEPTGVVAVLAPDEPDLLGLIREVAPALAAGNTVVASSRAAGRCARSDLGEIAGVSDVPGGTLNLLSGRIDELLDAAVRAPRRQRDRRRDRRRRARRRRSTSSRPRPSSASAGRAPDGDAASLARLEAVMELKTAWHPVGV